MIESKTTDLWVILFQVMGCVVFAIRWSIQTNWFIHVMSATTAAMKGAVLFVVIRG